MTSSRIGSYQTQLMALLSAGFGFVFLDRNAFSYLSPFIAPELHLNNTQVGILASALSFTWAVAGIVVGRISDSTGKRKIILVFAFVVFSLSSLISGLARSFLMLLAARLLMGVCEGPIMPISQSLLALESTAGRRGLNMGVMQNLGSNLIGNSIAPLVLVSLANAYNWRVAFFLAAVSGLLTAALIARWVREPARAQPPQLLSAAQAQPLPGLSNAGLLRHRNMWLCIVISCFMVAWMVLAWAFFPLFFVSVRKFSSSDMSILMSALGFCAAVCAIVVPWLSDRFGRKPVMIIFCLLGALTPAAALWLHASLWILAVVICIGWSASGVFPLFMATIPSETLPAGMIATALGVVMGTGEIVGGFCAPTVAGRAADLYGLGTPLLLEMVCAVAATAFALFLKETAPIKLQQALDTTPVALLHQD